MKSAALARDSPPLEFIHSIQSSNSKLEREVEDADISRWLGVFNLMLRPIFVAFPDHGWILL